MSISKSILVIGDVAWETRVDLIPQSINPELCLSLIESMPGGAAVNFACQTAILNLNTTLIIPKCDCEHWRTIEYHLTSNGVVLNEQLPTIPDIPYSIIVREKDKRQMYLDSKDDKVLCGFQYLPHSDHIHVTCVPYVLELLEFKEKISTLSVDIQAITKVNEYHQKFLEFADICFFSAKFFTVDKTREIGLHLCKIVKYGVVGTMGTRGVWVVDKRFQPKLISINPVDLAIDPVGAGDRFAAHVISDWVFSNDLVSAVQKGVFNMEKLFREENAKL